MRAKYGYLGKMLFVNLSEGKIQEEDLSEDLAKGFIRDFEIEMDGFNVVALNVTKLRSDNMDPREYMKRLKSWKKRVEGGGGHWKVINDLERLDSMLTNET